MGNEKVLIIDSDRDRQEGVSMSLSQAGASVFRPKRNKYSLRNIELEVFLKEGVWESSDSLAFFDIILRHGGNPLPKLYLKKSRISICYGGYGWNEKRALKNEKILIEKILDGSNFTFEYAKRILAFASDEKKTGKRIFYEKDFETRLTNLNKKWLQKEIEPEKNSPLSSNNKTLIIWNSLLDDDSTKLDKSRSLFKSKLLNPLKNNFFNILSENIDIVTTSSSFDRIKLSGNLFLDYDSIIKYFGMRVHRKPLSENLFLDYDCIIINLELGWSDLPFQSFKGLDIIYDLRQLYKVQCPIFVCSVLSEDLVRENDPFDILDIPCHNYINLNNNFVYDSQGFEYRPLRKSMLDNLCFFLPKATKED